MFLIKAYLDVKVSRDLFLYNPLLCAVKAKARKCVEELRKAGGVIDIPQFKLGKRLYMGVDLCLAAAHGDVEQLRCWEAAGSELIEADYDGRTALHVAVNHHQIDAVRYLMQQGLDPFVVDDFGTTPMSEAKRKNFKDIINVINEELAKRKASKENDSDSKEKSSAEPSQEQDSAEGTSTQ
ncbi:unnamed protein product [Cylicostephanus goldi]|uniref:Uncharacterized protein n=1 Tax=Cylicostephanus goldi TaxID=71465 RepID=A0A3P7QCW2_CYLGO|nr:unnamed protein product [Cylicostephanus goldi]